MDILRLKPAFNEEQAEALARLIDENMATKRDIEAVRAELKRDIEALRADLTNTIDSRAKDLRLEIAQLRGDVERGRVDLIKWMVGVGVAVIGVLFTLLKLFG